MKILEKQSTSPKFPSKNLSPLYCFPLPHFLSWHFCLDCVVADKQHTKKREAMRAIAPCNLPRGPQTQQPTDKGVQRGPATGWARPRTFSVSRWFSPCSVRESRSRSVTRVSGGPGGEQGGQGDQTMQMGLLRSCRCSSPAEVLSWTESHECFSVYLSLGLGCLLAFSFTHRNNSPK